MKEDIKEYLDRIRKTIADSKSLVSQAKLRMAETDRMLERQGLTREQVLNMRFSEAQIEAANAELKRRGFDPLERWDDIQGIRQEAAQASATLRAEDRAEEGAVDDEVAYRQRKFGMMMKPFVI